MIRHRWIAAAVVAAVMGMALTGCNAGGRAEQDETQPSGTGIAGSETDMESGSLKEITFVLDWTPNTNHTGLYVAREKGYFKEEGLNVKIVQPPEDGAVVLVASGKAQFGMSFQDSLAPAVAGESAMPVTAVAAVIQHNTSGIVSRKGEGMDRPKGMEGKTYATWEMPIEKAMVKNVVESDGGDYGKVKLVPSTVTDEVSALRTKSVDSIWIFYAWAGVKMELEGLDTDYFAFADLNPVFDYYTPVIIAGNKVLEEKPEMVKKFLAATSRGYGFAMEKPEESAEILHKYAPDYSLEMLTMSQKYLADKYAEDADRWGEMKDRVWDNYTEFMVEYGVIQEAIPAAECYTNEFLPDKE